MSCSATSDFSTIPVSCEQRLELHFAEIKQKLNDLIYKEQVNQLWKLGVESTLHSIWSRVCYQHACVSTSCQTDELLEEDCDTLLELPIHFNETSRALLEEEDELNHEELHTAVEVVPSSSSSAHENEISATFPCSKLPITRGNANGNLAKKIHFCSDQQQENVHRNETSRTMQEEQQDVVEAIPSSSPSAHENEMSASDASPEKPIQRTTRSRSNRVKLYPSKFSRKVETSQHERTHVKSSSKCDKCLQVFANVGFTMHRRFCSHKPNETGFFECAECGKLYSTKDKLKDHLRHMHYSEKKHKCPVCGRAFVWRSQVKYHMATHTGAKPFRCKFCSKCYASGSGLGYHLQTCHAK